MIVLLVEHGLVLNTNMVKSINFLGGIIMGEKKELLNEEVNVYSKECGTIKYQCEHDCIGGGALISTSN